MNFEGRVQKKNDPLYIARKGHNAHYTKTTKLDFESYCGTYRGVHAFVFLLRWIGICFVLISLFASIIIAQPLLTQSLQFKSGVYLSYEEFQTNQPSYGGTAIKAAYFQNPQSEEIKVEYIRLIDSEEYLSVDSIWGIGIKGIPYVRVALKKPVEGLYTFAKMEVRGNICYYYYTDREEKMIPFAAYNPLTGKPFRKATIRREVETLKEKMLRFETGEVVDFNYTNVLAWIAQEEELVQALKSLGPKEGEKSLFKTLLLYDDRNEVKLKKSKFQIPSSNP